MTFYNALSSHRLAVLGLGAVLLAGCDGHAPGPATQLPVRPVRVEAVHLEQSAATARYAAVLRPRIESDFGFPVGGKLVARLVETGSPGAAGARALPRRSP